jgi:hypothetical protein
VPKGLISITRPEECVVDGLWYEVQLRRVDVEILPHLAA